MIKLILVAEVLTMTYFLLIASGIMLSYGAFFYMKHKFIKKDDARRKQLRKYEKSKEAQSAKELDECKSKLKNERDEYLYQSKTDSKSLKSKKYNSEREL